jgi:hypothetical protein
VRASTTGRLPDQDGYAVTAAGHTEALPASGEVRFPDVAPGQYQVALAGLASNCATQGAVPRAVSVTAGVEATVDFTVVCGAGTLRVLVSTSGDDLDTDGYQIAVVGVGTQPAALQDTLLFDPVPSGPGMLQVDGRRENCDVPSQALQVQVANDQTAEASVPVTCLTVVLVDEYHFNSHNINTSYAAFARVARSGGFFVRGLALPASSVELAEGSVLVVPNALHQSEVNPVDWFLPTDPAFTAGEATVIGDWVRGGGALLLIADHMPFPGAALPLAQEFGVQFSNGFAFDTTQLAQPQSCLAANQIQIFRRSDGSLAPHAITDGRNATERVDSVGTFTGQAFQAGPAASLLVFGADAISLYPDTAWAFHAGTPQVGVQGWSQGAALETGSGRAVFIGEAAMLSEQTCGGGVPMGMNAPAAGQNRQFLLNTLRWLVGEIP